MKNRFNITFITPANNKSSAFGVIGTDIAYVSKNINYGAESGYILYMANAGANSTEYTVNGDSEKTVIIPGGEWCHLKLAVNKTAGTVTVDITGATLIFFKHYLQ